MEASGSEEGRGASEEGAGASEEGTTSLVEGMVCELVGTEGVTEETVDWVGCPQEERSSATEDNANNLAFFIDWPPLDIVPHAGA